MGAVVPPPVLQPSTFHEPFSGSWNSIFRLSFLNSILSENACMMANIFDKVEFVRIRNPAPLGVLFEAFEVIVYHIL